MLCIGAKLYVANRCAQPNVVLVFLCCLQIASWLAARALQLDAATGQLPEALQLLELAVDKGYGQFQVRLLPRPIIVAGRCSCEGPMAGAVAKGKDVKIQVTAHSDGCGGGVHLGRRPWCTRLYNATPSTRMH